MQQFLSVLSRLLFLLLSVSISNALMGNMSAPPEPTPGNLTGDSYFNHLTVIRENLMIDLSELNQWRPVKVRASYVLQCTSGLNNLDLIFVANGLDESRFRIEVDNQRVHSELTKFDSIPYSWLPPDSIEGINQKIPFVYTTEGLILFRIDSLSPGQHTIVVNYEASASEWFEKEDLSMTRTFVYILKPTDDWKRFENFNLEVIPPDGWELSSNLSLMEGENNSLTGTWKTLPAHHVSLAVRKSPLSARIASILYYCLSWPAFILLAIFWMKRVAIFRIQKDWHKIVQVVNSMLISFLATSFFFVIFFSNHSVRNYFLDNHINPWVGRGSGYIIITFPFLWALAMLITVVVDYKLTEQIKVNLRSKKVSDIS